MDLFSIFELFVVGVHAQSFTIVHDRKLRNRFSATRSSPNRTESNALLRPTGIHLLRVRRCLFYSSVHCSRSPCRSPLIKTCCRWYTTREGCQLPHIHVSPLAKAPLPSPWLPQRNKSRCQSPELPRKNVLLTIT